MIMPKFKMTPYLAGDLYFFSVVARRQSFSVAALDLNVSQAAVSQRIRQLEERFGESLFFRHSRGISLTPLGADLFAAVEGGFSSISDGVSALLKRGQESRIAISCSPSFAMEWLMPRLARFYGLHPDIQLTVAAEYQSPTRELLQRTSTDLAIRYEPQLNHPGLNALNLHEELIFPVVAPDFPRGDCSDASLERLLKDSVLLHDAEAWAGAPKTQEWDTWLVHSGMKPTSESDGRFFNLANLAVAAARQGEGIAMGRATVVLDAIRRGELAMLGTRIARSGIWYRVLTHGDLNANSPAHAFLTWLQAEMRATCEEFKEFFGLQ